MRAGALGVVAGSTAGVAVAKAASGDTLVPWPGRIRQVFPVAIGGAVALLAGTATHGIASVFSPRQRQFSVTGAAVVVGGVVAVGVGGRIAAGRVLGGIARKGRELDPAFASAPPSENVSGSVSSLVSMDELGREGARFVWTTATDTDAKAVTGKKLKKAPIRVFVGVDAAATPEQRVGLAMAELRRTGAFERKVLLIEAPAGSGYSNPTPIDVMEILNAGDCAAVSIGYGVMPSFLSLGTVPLASRTQRLLIEAIAGELSSLGKKRPRVLLYGESLGAKVMQAAVPRGPADFDEFGIDGALFVGTPGGASSDAFHAMCRDVSYTVDNPSQLPAVVGDPRPRVWFLEHDGDPVVRFRPELITERPSWLPTDGTRGRNVPESMAWKPVVTWMQVLVDVLFATNIKPGDFKSLGHDYRADLGPVVSMAFDFTDDPAVVAALDVRLREIEVERARRIDDADPVEPKTDDSGTASLTP